MAAVISSGRRRLLCWFIGCRWRHFDNCAQCARCGRILLFLDHDKGPMP